MMKKTLSVACSLISVYTALSIGAAPIALAQGGKILEEVVVTARRREESLQDVPLAVTSISGETLERIGAADIVAAAQSIPNVTLEVSRGTNTTLTAFIRGVGQQDPVAGFESGVGIYIDDVYLNRPMAAVLDIYDIDRLEVLRGPQGTLYGRNTIGGAVKYVTKQLDEDAMLKVRASLGNYSQTDLVITGSIPLSDTLSIGGSVARLTRDGFGENLTLGLDNYSKDYLGGRVRLEWDASENLSFNLTADASQDDSDPKQGHRLTVGGLSGAPILDDVFNTRAGLNQPIQSVDAKGMALVTKLTINEQWLVKNVLAYREDESMSPIDFDSLPVDDLDVPILYDNDQLSEELQLLYTGDSLSGILGLYYLDSSAFNIFDAVLGPTGAFLNLPGLNANTLGDVNTKTWSVFGDFSYEISNAWSVSLGGRYTSDKRSSKVLRQTFLGGISPTFGGTAFPILTTSDFVGSETFNEFSPRVSVSWKPNDEHSYYLSYSEGFKGGGFDPRSQTTAAPDVDGDGDIDATDIFTFMLFEPETVKSFEAGAKSSWLDSSVTTNLAVFLGSYENVQVPGSIGFDSDSDGTIDSFIGITSNAADADINGVEFEGMALLSESWSFSWALGYIDAEYNEYIDAFGADVASQRVFQNTPELTAAGTLSYEVPCNIASESGSLAVITSVSYRDDTSQFEAPSPLLDQESYSLWDLSLVWEADDGDFRIGLHGKNLTDEEYKVAGYNLPNLGFEGSVTGFYGNPRMVTGTLEYTF